MSSWTEPSARYPAIPVRRDVDDGGYTLCVLILLCVTLFQKVALPGTGGALSISTIIVPMLFMSGWLLGVLLLDIYAFLAFSAFIASAGLSLYLNGGLTKISISSIALLTLVQSMLCFKRNPEATGFRRAGDFFVNWMFVLAIVGIIQYVAQYIVGPKIAFAVDFYMPPDMLVKVFNNLNPLYYGSPYYKSNGVFFAEPSIFSQCVGMALVTEFATRQRPLRVIVFLIALLCSFSGTGMIVLALFGTFQILKKVNVGVLVAGGILLGIVVVMGGALQLDALTNRINEFATPNSSGHARFISIFGLLDAVTFTNSTWALFGTGPGTISNYFSLLPYLVFDPTWGKIIFEYGVLGAAGYIYYFTIAVSGPASPYRGPLILIYFLLGGYFLDASILALIAVLLVYQNPPQIYLAPRSEIGATRT